MVCLKTWLWVACEREWGLGRRARVDWRSVKLRDQGCGGVYWPLFPSPLCVCMCVSPEGIYPPPSTVLFIPILLSLSLFPAVGFGVVYTMK